MKAKKKPVEIEFLTYEEVRDGTLIFEMFNKGYKNLKYLKYENNYILIETLEGTMKMTNKDYLIIGVRGELYPCKIDIFNETYEIVDGTDE